MKQIEQANTLLSYYESLYEDRYGRKAPVNRVKDKWPFNDIIEDIGAVRTRELLDYYFTLSNKPGHPLQFFFYNYERINAIVAERDEDRQRRRKLRQETQQRSEEFSRGMDEPRN